MTFMSSGRPLFTFGLTQDKEYFIENLSMLASSGMPISQVIESIGSEVRTYRMKRVLESIHEDIDAGTSLWKALEKTGLFKEHITSLIRLGEQSGKLTENLEVIAVEESKQRTFRSKVRSAMLYPVFVLGLTAVIGVGIAWFILPKLAVIFSQLRIKLPLITQLLIRSGIFLKDYGRFVIPVAVLFLILLFFFLFSFSKTKFLGQFILFMLPGIRGLMKEIETSRFGYLLGTLLKAGMPVNQALDSLASATDFSRYRKFYLQMKESIEEGNSFQKTFAQVKHAGRFIPATVQSLILAGEQAGKMPDTFLKVGKIYEKKADNATKNLSVILEPVLLVIVWLGVVGVAIAVVLPIYSLIGGFDPSASMSAPTPIVSQESKEIAINTKPAETPLPEKRLSISVLSLNVREGASPSSKILLKVKQGESYVYTNQENGWYQIIVREGVSGWVSGQFVKEGISPVLNASKNSPKTQIPSSSGAQTTLVIRVDFGTLNVRSGPSVSNPVKTTVKNSERLVYISEKDGWYEIILPDGTTGWVSGRYVTIK